MTLREQGNRISVKHLINEILAILAVIVTIFSSLSWKTVLEGVTIITLGMDCENQVVHVLAGIVPFFGKSEIYPRALSPKCMIFVLYQADLRSL